MTPFTRSVLAAVLLAAPVVAESTHLVDSDATAGAWLFGVGQLVGWLLVGTVVRGLGAGLRRESRWGSRLVVAGVAAMILFAAVWLASRLATGEAWGASFLAFLLGFVCLVVGGARWAWRLWRAGHRDVARGLGGVAFFGLVASAVGDSVVHEVALPLSYLAWILVGRGAEGSTVAAPEGVSAGSR